jgi:hypothetical protein
MARRSKPKTTPEAARDVLLLQIAERHLFLDTLETRMSDSLDFHDHAVWAVRSALEAAFEAGRRADSVTPPPPSKDPAMTSITTIRIDHAVLPDPLATHGPDAAARMIEAALREGGVSAEASDVISHLKIELPTSQLAAASALLADLRLI